MKYFKVWLRLIVSRELWTSWYFCLFYFLFALGLPNMTIEELPYKLGMFSLVMFGIAVLFSSMAIVQFSMIEWGKKKHQQSMMSVEQYRTWVAHPMFPAKPEPEVWPPNPKKEN